MTAKVINADLAISAKIISIWRGAGPFASTWVIGREKERCSIRKAHPVQSLVVGAMQRFWLIVTKGKSWQRKVIQKSCCKIGHQLHCGQCQVWPYYNVGTGNVHDIECSVGSLLLWITYWLGKKSPKFLLRKKKKKEGECIFTFSLARLICEWPQMNPLECCWNSSRQKTRRGPL